MKTTRVLLLPLLITSSTLFSVANSHGSTCKAGQPGICTRACWGARAPACNPGALGALTRAIVHHTAGTGDWTTDYATGQSRVRGIQNYHIDVAGFCDISYQFLVNAGGHIYEGRSGAMASLPKSYHDCCNYNSFGFNVMGYYHPPYNQSFTTASRNSLMAVIAWRMPTGWSPYGSGGYCSRTVGFLDSHRRVVESCGPTACPGDIVHAAVGDNFWGGEIRNGVSSRRACGSTGVIVDNNSAGFSASASWSTGSSAADKYGADYRFRSTQPISDSATWTANLGSTRAYTVYVWYPQGANRSPTAPFIIYHAGGSTTEIVNQQITGGQWVNQGTYNMNAGNNQVKLSCWTGTGYVVVADAVKWE